MADPGSGELAVRGGPVNETIEFSSTGPVEFRATFIESALPIGTNGSVVLGGTKLDSTGPYLTFVESNGSSAFSVGSVPAFGANPSNGTAVVSGTGLSLAVTYSRVYAVSFDESSLPADTHWSVTLTQHPGGRSVSLERRCHGCVHAMVGGHDVGAISSSCDKVG